MGNYQELFVWKRTHSFALQVYRSTQAFPECERYGLTSQLRRAAISAVSNIAEASGRHSDRDEMRFFRIAQGSLCEVQSELLISRDIGYLNHDAWVSLDSQCREIGKMLNGLIRSYRVRSRSNQKGAR